VVAIAGNHDFIFQSTKYAYPTDLPWSYLQDSGIFIHGFNPWQPVFYDWSFNAEEIFSKIPENTDILICHGPPWGLGDISNYYDEEKWPDVNHVGSRAMRARAEQLKDLKLLVCGHIRSV
jgi:hypothetical protein